MHSRGSLCCIRIHLPQEKVASREGVGEATSFQVWKCLSVLSLRVLSAEADRKRIDAL